MESADGNTWTGTDILAHLNDFKPSIAENIIKDNHNRTVQLVNDDHDKSSNTIKSHSKDTSSAKVGIKIPTLQGANKNYVLQCQEDMTQEFLDYLKDKASSFYSSSDSGK